MTTNFFSSCEFEKELLLLGHSWCSTDYAVRNYLFPHHPKFFCKIDKLLSAVNRASEQGNKLERRERNGILQELKSHGIVKHSGYRDHILHGEDAFCHALLSLSDENLEKFFYKIIDKLNKDADTTDFFLLDCGFRENPAFDPDDIDCDEDFLLSDQLRQTIEKTCGAKGKHAYVAFLVEELLPALSDSPEPHWEFPLHYAELAKIVADPGSWRQAFV